MFCIVDPHLKEIGEHYYNYDIALAEASARRNLSYLIIAPQSDLDTGNFVVYKVLPDLSSSRARQLKAIPLIGGQAELIAKNLIFFFSIRNELSPSKICQDWVIFDPMITANHLLGFLIWLLLIPGNCKAQIVLLFMRPLSSLGGSGFLRLSVYLLKRVARRTHLHLCTENESTRKAAESITGLRWELLELPLAVGDNEPVPSSTGRIKFASLGSARAEKGFNLLIQTLLLLHETGQLSQYEFHIQIYSPRRIDRNLLERVKQLHSDSIVFYEKALSREAYFDFIRGADVILLPYRSNIYGKAGSGTFTEALSFGKPVVATQGTWMSQQLQHFGAGLLCRDDDPSDLARAIHEIASNLDVYIKKAQATKTAWQQLYSSDVLLNRILRLAQ